jgi:hypothetical protein
MDIAKIAADAEKAIFELQVEKGTYEEKIAEIERQIEGWNQVLVGLHFLGNPEAQLPLPRQLDLEGLGIQEAILKILRLSPMPLTPVEIRDLMMLSGVTAASPKNLLISIHTAIVRLSDKLEEVKRSDGKPTYTLRQDGLTQRRNAFLDSLAKVKRRKI